VGEGHEIEEGVWNGYRLAGEFFIFLFFFLISFAFEVWIFM
jgi:hypothetical protein